MVDMRHVPDIYGIMCVYVGIIHLCTEGRGLFPNATEAEKLNGY